MSDQQPKVHIRRRTILATGIGAFGLSGVLASILSALPAPSRLDPPSITKLPDIQFDITPYLAPARVFDADGFETKFGVPTLFGPVYTLFLPGRLRRTPTMHDQQQLANALHTIESVYPLSPEGIFLFVAYGLPYFQRLPSTLLFQHIPRLLSDPMRFAFEEAQPGPTDVSEENPQVRKQTYHLPVTIEHNDVLFTMRSDSLHHIQDVATWLQGNSTTLNGKKMQPSTLEKVFVFEQARLQFVSPGLPRSISTLHRLPYAKRIHPHSPMWMGFADQQVNASGPAAMITFQGTAAARFTTTKTGDYFFNGAVQHLSQSILDLNQFYGDSQPYAERCQQMFRSNPPPALGNPDQFSNGGGPAFLENIFQGRQDAEANAQALATFGNEHRLGHLCALQRTSRAADGTPLHIRMDGPGFDTMDVPDGSNQPKLHFTIFVPTADVFVTMRRSQASLDLAHRHKIDERKNGLERFLTTTRRQNFLVPPRLHRSFPLLELAATSQG